MGNFRRDDRDDGDRPRRSGGFGRDRPRSGGFGGGRGGGFRRDSRRPLEMHEVTCSKCGKQCEVPFKPTGDKPVFCSDCFRKEDSGSSRGSFRGGGSSGVSSAELDKINEKLDKIIKALEIE